MTPVTNTSRKKDTNDINGGRVNRMLGLSSTLGGSPGRRQTFSTVTDQNEAPEEFLPPVKREQRLSSPARRPGEAPGSCCNPPLRPEPLSPGPQSRSFLSIHTPRQA